MGPEEQQAVLSWGESRRRDLPWRRTRDPWAVLVSEVMLQQTQVARVVPRFADFMARFPTVASCGAAPVGDVLTLWSGLGYNRRAVSLHGAARAVVSEHGGRFPSTVAALRRLPGVGPYTARAILAFAFEADAAVVDTNIARTLARWHGRTLRAAEVQAQADAALPAGGAWAWNQSLMDLGATVCTARQPACVACPLADSCRWRADQGEEPDPAAGSALTSRPQSRFEGSDRQGRGRLVRAMAAGPVRPDELASVMGWPEDQERASRVAAGLVGDGLAVVAPSGGYALP